MTHIQFSRECMSATQQEICNRLGYTPEDIANHIYQNGLSYLAEYFKTLPVMAHMMEGQKIFWNWWKNEWHLRNLVYLNDAEIIHCSLAWQRLAYEAYNDASALTTRIAPARVVYVGVLPTLKLKSCTHS